MPIRLCQKCGLKVLIDESQAGTNPFYCQRCTTAMKGQENAAAAAPSIKNPTPSPVAMANRSDPAAPSVGAAKAATVRVLCPYCKASFNGRVPQKPARGSCPVCQKELILLPNGDIKPAAGFDLGTYQGDGAPAGKSADPIPEAAAAPMPKESGTRLLVKKYAAESQLARPAAIKPDPLATPSPVAAPAETDTADDTNPLPGWLDDSAQGLGDVSSPEVKAQPETDVNIDVVEPPPQEEVVEEPPPPPPSRPQTRPRAPIAAKMSGVPSGRPPASIEPPPEAPAEEPVDLLPPDPPARKPTGRIPKQPPAAAPVAAASYGEETGGGKVFLALFLALLPVLAGAGLLSSRDKLNSNDLVKKIGTRLTVGFGKLHLKLFPPPPPAPAIKIEEKKPVVETVKEEPPKPDPEQQKKDELKISQIADQCRLLRRKLKENTTAATPAQQAEFQKVRDDLALKEAKIKELRGIYRKMYGTDYDPDKQ